MTIGTVPHPDKNNLIPVTGDALGLTVEPLLQTFTRYDFTFQYIKADLMNAGDCAAGLLPRTGILAPYTFSQNDCPISVEWSQSFPFVGGGYSGVPGTVTETWRSFGKRIARRLDIDPGSDGRLGKRYTLLLSGTEYRGYVNYSPSGGNTPLAIVTGPGDGFPYPLRLAMLIENAIDDRLQIQDIMLAGNLGSKTIYSGRDKADDGSLAGLHLRIYQLPNGVPVDIDV